MDLIKLQLSELICRHSAKENGLYDLPEIIIESMMVAERSEFLANTPDNKGYMHASQRVAGTRSRIRLSSSVRGLRTHQDSSQQFVIK